MKNVIILITILLLSLAISSCFKKNANPLLISEKSGIETVRITHSDKFFEKTDTDWISDLIKQAGLSTPTNKETIQDVPNVPEYIKIDFILHNGNENTLFVYQEKTIWYIEQPYQGIYLANDDFIEIITNKENVSSELNDTPILSVSETKNSETLDEAIKWYLQEKVSNLYFKGDYFASSFRILDINEISDSITVYTHIICEWVDLEGNIVSGGSGLTSITFKKVNNTYNYEKANNYIKPDDYPEIPQKVKDAVSTASYFNEMQAEIDKDIADFLSLPK